MRVLLTGAAGFIGTAIADQLQAAGHEVVGVDALIPEAWAASPDLPAVEHRLDVRDAASWVSLLRGVDVVCHQAAMVGAGETAADLPSYASHNDVGTAALLAALHDASVSRLVLASSMVVYGEGRYACIEHGRVTPALREIEALRAGDFDSRCPRCGRPVAWELVDEEAPLDPRSGYAASKVAQEHYASAWARQSGGRVIALRYHNVYGPWMPRDTPYSGVAAIFRSSLERGEAPRVFEDGGQMRDFVHVHDVARANALALEAVVADESRAFEAFNVCSGTPISILDVARALGAQNPRVTGEFRSGDVRHVVASPARAAERLGFVARVTPAQGLAHFASDPLR